MALSVLNPLNSAEQKHHAQPFKGTGWQHTFTAVVTYGRCMPEQQDKHQGKFQAHTSFVTPCTSVPPAACAGVVASDPGVAAVPLAPTMPSAGATLEVPQEVATPTAAAAVPPVPLQPDAPTTTTIITTMEQPVPTAPTDTVEPLASDPTPTTDPISSTEPVPGPTPRRHGRRAVNITAATVVPAAFTYVTCKLDAAGNVADVVFSRPGGSSTAGCSTAVSLPGGRNVLLDFYDSQIVQVSWLVLCLA
jgi:hypothetical protein